jgi:hypothetical protein
VFEFCPDMPTTSSALLKPATTEAQARNSDFDRALGGLFAANADM